MLYVDTESVGLTGPTVLIQTAIDNEEPELYHVWDNPVQETLDYIEGICEQNVCLFNASHDSFQLHKLYNILSMVSDRGKKPHAGEFREIEQTLPRKYCLRPPLVHDIYCYLKREKYQWLAGRAPIEIFSVPIQSAEIIRAYLDEWTKKNLPPILFARYKNKRQLWTIVENTGEKAKAGFVNLKLEFAGTLGLKAITEHHFKVPVKKMDMPYYYFPNEWEFAPQLGDWTRKLQQHIFWWRENQHAIQYATEDILWLQKWAKELKLEEETRDIDSCLAWMVGGVRHHGMNIDVPGIQEYLKSITDSSIPMAPAQALSYIREVLSPIERLAIKNTKKKTLEAVAKNASNDEARTRANAVLNRRKEQKRIELLEKLIAAGRFFPDFNVVGTLSNRMSGRSGINPQGIAKEEAIRKLFTLADPGWTLSGGDFDGQETTIAAKLYNDNALTADLLAGKSIHQLLAAVIAQVDYDDPSIAKGTKNYNSAKGGVFSLIYGAQVPTFSSTIGVSDAAGQKIYDDFGKKYPGVKAARANTFKKFCPMTQPGGQGSKVIWGEPDRFSYSLGGYRRDFFLENAFCKLFFELANNLTKLVGNLPDGKVERKKDRIQTITGATQTAIYGASFRIQQKNMAAAANNEIQATGAEITKRLQYNIYTLQPKGVHEYVVIPINIHDEVLVVNKEPEMIRMLVDLSVKDMKKDIPLLSITWKERLGNWGEK